MRVPVENLVGERNKGWSYGKYLLGHERTGIAGIGSCKQQLARARRLAQAQGWAMTRCWHRSWRSSRSR